MILDLHSSDETLPTTSPAQSSPTPPQSEPLFIASGLKALSVTISTRDQGKDRATNLPSSLRTSEDTLVAILPTKKSKKAKKGPTPGAQRPTKTNERLPEQIARIFADQLSSGTKYVDPSDVLQRFIASQRNEVHQKTTITVSTTPMDILETQTPTSTNKMKAKYRTPGSVFSLEDRSTFSTLESLVECFGQVSHMGVLDSSYSFFLSQSHTAALLFKIYDKVAVVSGDPLCNPDQIPDLLLEFGSYRKKLHLDICFVGATASFVEYAMSRGWTTMQFGVERVLNPTTNPLLLETGVGKRTLLTAKQLLKKGVTLSVYIPRFHGPNPTFQDQITSVYTAWRNDRNASSTIQAYVSILDPMALPNLMVYILATDPMGIPCGFAALRRTVQGYHIDPCVATPTAPRGTSELLILSSLSLLHHSRPATIDPNQNPPLTLSLGFDPSSELGTITGLPRLALNLTRSIHRHSFASLPIGGKHAFYDKFRPDEALQGDMFVVVPGRRGVPRVRHVLATMHTANIDVSRVLREGLKRAWWGEKEVGNGEGEIDGAV